MFDTSSFKHHRSIEELTQVLCSKTQNTDKSFFKAEIAYFLGKVASSMRVNIQTKDRGNLPVNIYSLALAGSGYGKGHSINIMEQDILKGFEKRFLEETMPFIVEKSLWDLGNERALKKATDPDEERSRVLNEYTSAGAFYFTFDAGSSPAIKQMRHKLLMAKCGSINFQMDELGSNLIGNTEALNTFLELYDLGFVKSKITKNTGESTRTELIEGGTPTNILLFGTPNKLFDGSVVEQQFYSFLEIGYARRCIFGMGHKDKRAFHSKSPEDIYYDQINPVNAGLITKWNKIFTDLANPTMYNWTVNVEDDIAIKLLKYKLDCEKLAESLPDHDEIRKAELSNRYFKALKLSGAFAFIDNNSVLTEDQLNSAILLIEESGQAFDSILNREKSYMKLAKYIADVGTDLTHADLYEALPFYKAGITARNELINLAVAWGYKQHILIKKTFIDGIEFFHGETLAPTDLSKIVVSYSDQYSDNYLNDSAPFDQLHKLVLAPSLSFCNHAMEGGHRSSETTLPGFNMIVLDVDGGVSVEAVKSLLSDYKYMMYTTKSHTEQDPKFRVLIPTNYKLELDTIEYKEFMNSVMEWLPFSIDEASNRAAQKWLCNNKGQVIYNDEGELLDVLPFIPRTTKNEAHNKQMKSVASLSNLERWFSQQMSIGNRNNNMLKYGLILVDSGMSLVEVTNRIYEFNNKLDHPLSVQEIKDTVLVTVSKKYNVH